MIHLEESGGFLFYFIMMMIRKLFSWQTLWKSDEKIYWLVIVSLRVETWDLTVAVVKLKTETKAKQDIGVIFTIWVPTVTRRCFNGDPILNLSFYAKCTAKGGNAENQIHRIARSIV